MTWIMTLKVASAARNVCELNIVEIYIDFDGYSYVIISVPVYRPIHVLDSKFSCHNNLVHPTKTTAKFTFPIELNVTLGHVHI